MTEWATRPADNRTWVHTVPFFKNKMAVTKLYEAVSGNTSGGNGFLSANTITEIVGELKSRLEEMKSRQEDELTHKDEEHVLATREFMGANCCQESEITNVKTQISHASHML